ncbi:putative chromatin regulator PHD family [Medicago truncatula]|uniref:Putative chromatin regulator PHD family n=1 Tax=Medicago truncatula TaxID=3880 RepID=A0A396HFM4_MEDTR|nr:uncharacterized protein LOC11446591 [Medicago truncatula]RHN51341.1 putative chromatin regulator PHD family [Medicago truncatula]
MIGDFQNNYRSGWDVMPFNHDMPFNDFSLESLNLNFDYQIPHDMGFADDRPSSHHTSAHYADNRHLQHRRGHHYADDRPSSHQTSADYSDNKRLEHRKPAHYVDKRQLPDQMPGHYSDKRPLPHQKPKGFAGKRNLPRQPPEDFADKRSLPHQKPEEYADNKCLPHRAPKPYSDKKRLPQQRPKDFADKKCLPHQTPGPTIPALAPVQRRQSNIVRCKICHVTMDHKCLEEHHNGKKHRMKLEELHEQSTERSVPNGRDSRLFPNSSGMNPVVQPMKVAESKKNGHPVKNVCREAPRFSNKEVPAVDSKLKSGDYAGAKDLDFKVENVRPSFKQKNVLAESSKRKLGDNTGPKDRGFKVGNVRPSLKQKNVLAESSTRKLWDNTGPKDCGLKGENVKNEAPILKHKNVPAERSKRKLMDNTGAKDDGSKLDIRGAVGDKYMKMDNGVRKPVKSSKPEANAKSGSVKSLVQRPGLKSSKPEVNAKSSSVKSLVQKPGLKQPSGCVASPKMTPIPVEGSSFEIQSRHVSASLSQESKGNEHHKFQNIVEKNDQPQLVNASTGSNMTHTAGSMTNNQTEVVNSDFAAIKVVTEPLASAPTDASVSSVELLTEHGLHTAVEPQVSEAAVEIDAPADVSTETEAADESSQSEVEMDVLVTVSETTKLPQIPVCLTCGDVGFEETLVYCNKCKACALHRYCLDGPVIFTDEVIWFCEDCETDVVVINDSDSESTDSDNETTDSDIEIIDSEKGEVDSSKGCATAVTIADPQPISDPIWRGSLLVLNKSFDKIITGLLCHLSTLACPKVLEETKHLPNVLDADMIQREAVWPKSFWKFGTNNLSIGLYFFPQNERDERYFDQLVDEMISNDLAMRARVEKAELLIFPSTMLPSKYKRFQSKYYLWGVYRRNQVPTKIHDDASSRNE